MKNSKLVLTAIAITLTTLILGCATAPKTGQTGKLNHVGLVWLKEPGNVAQRQQLIDAAHRFAREIPEVRLLSVGEAAPKGGPLHDSTFDVCLTMQFDDQAALDRYAKNPVHQKEAQEAFLPLAQKILFYDFISK